MASIFRVEPMKKPEEAGSKQRQYYAIMDIGAGLVASFQSTAQALPHSLIPQKIGICSRMVREPGES